MTEENKLPPVPVDPASTGSAPKGETTTGVESGVPGVGGVRTPRTEANRLNVAQRTNRAILCEMVDAGFARVLERESIAANERCHLAEEQWSKVIDELERMKTAFDGQTVMWENCIRQRTRITNAAIAVVSMLPHGSDRYELEQAIDFITGGGGAEHLEASPAEKEQNVASEPPERKL